MNIDHSKRAHDRPTHRRRLFGALALMAFSALAAGCDVHKASDPGSLSTFVVSPSSQTLAINGTQQFTATGTDFAGVATPTSPSWSIVSGGGTISANGMFTAGTVPGTYTSTVKATSGSMSSTATIIVTVGTLATITVTPTPDTLSVGGIRQYSAVGRDVAGNVVAFTPTWTVNNGGGSIVSGTGVFTAGTLAGSFANTIRASSGAITGTATTVVTAGALATLVIAPGPVSLTVLTTQQFTVSGRDAAGNVVTVVPVWSVANGGGTIAPTTGLFTAGALPGVYSNTVRATVGSISAATSVTVTIGALASIVITPNPVSLNTSVTQQFVATGRDAAGNTLTITPTWSVANGGGSINASSGMFTAGTIAGTFANTIVATAGTISGTATLDITALAATIVVTPNPASVSVGATQSFVAVVRDAAGNIISVPVVWSIVNGGGSVVATTGVFTAGPTAGSYVNTIRAAIGAVSGTASITVTAGALATIIVTPNPVTMNTSTTQQFTATGQDASGNSVTIVPVWQVSSGGGTINATSGLFTAGTTSGTYANTVVAVVGALTGSATVNVVVVVATITVTPNPATVAAGATQAFVAVARDAAGNTVAATPVWSITNGGGTVNAVSGLFTAGTTPGSFPNTVRATVGSAFGAASVTVTAGPLATITVAPNPASVAASATQSFVAVGRDAFNNVVVVTATWSIVAGGGTINATTGLFTAGVVTGTYIGTVRALSGSVSGVATVTVTAAAPPPIIDLGAAGPNGIISGTALTCVTGGLVGADISISPGSTVTGFGPCFLTGVRHLADATAAQAQIDLTTAYNTLDGLACPPGNAIVANLGGTTKTAGVYCTASGIGVTGTLTIDGGGDPNAAFVFKAGTALTTAGDVVMTNGAQAKNVYWLVGSSATIGTASQWQGNIIALTSITLVDNATLIGRALARNGAISLGTNNVITLP